MNFIWKFILVILVFGIALSCRRTPQDLIGRWVSTSIEDLQTGKIRKDSAVQILFKENGRYHYSIGFRIREAGRYYSTNPNLYLTDTTAASPIERKSQIRSLTSGLLSMQLGIKGDYYILHLRKADAIGAN